MSRRVLVTGGGGCHGRHDADGDLARGDQRKRTRHATHHALPVGAGRRRRSDEMSRRVLVTGGAGFIGSHIADAYLARGDKVWIVDDLSSGRVGNLPAGATFVQASIGA